MDTRGAHDSAPPPAAGWWAPLSTGRSWRRSLAATRRALTAVSPSAPRSDYLCVRVTHGPPSAAIMAANRPSQRAVPALIYSRGFIRYAGLRWPCAAHEGRRRTRGPHRAAVAGTWRRNRPGTRNWGRCCRASSSGASPGGPARTPRTPRGRRPASAAVRRAAAGFARPAPVRPVAAGLGRSWVRVAAAVSLAAGQQRRPTIDDHRQQACGHPEDALTGCSPLGLLVQGCRGEDPLPLFAGPLSPEVE